MTAEQSTSGKKAPQLSRKQRKEALQQLLEQRDISALLVWATTERSSHQMLSSFLCQDDALLAWRAIEAFGLTIAAKAKDDLEVAREAIRRLFWSMNDESGNLIRRAPEAIAEILFHLPVLVREYSSMLSSFLEEEPFEKGTRWALGRIGIFRPVFPEETAITLFRSLADKDSCLRGSSLMALRFVPWEEHWREAVAALLDDPALCDYYDFTSGDLRQISVGEVAVLVLQEKTGKNP